MSSKLNRNVVQTLYGDPQGVRRLVLCVDGTRQNSWFVVAFNCCFSMADRLELTRLAILLVVQIRVK
jgi:hypothetical protein